MFGYRIRFIPGKKAPYKEDLSLLNGDLAQGDLKNVNYRYEQLYQYATKR
jgi:hypothetical protein